jgi:hypothetical protein
LKLIDFLQVRIRWICWLFQHSCNSVMWP